MIRNIPDPSISRNLVIKGAGIFWIIGGLILLFRAYSMTSHMKESILILSLIAVTISVIKSKWIFSKIVNKNIKRIEMLVPYKKKICLFAFQSIESYILIIVMIISGLLLRKTNLSEDILFVIYLAIGLSLLTSSRKYIFWRNS